MSSHHACTCIQCCNARTVPRSEAVQPDVLQVLARLVHAIESRCDGPVDDYYDDCLDDARKLVPANLLIQPRKMLRSAEATQVAAHRCELCGLADRTQLRLSTAFVCIDYAACGLRRERGQPGRDSAAALGPQPWDACPHHPGNEIQKRCCGCWDWPADYDHEGKRNASVSNASETPSGRAEMGSDAASAGARAAPSRARGVGVDAGPLAGREAVAAEAPTVSLGAFEPFDDPHTGERLYRPRSTDEACDVGPGTPPMVKAWDVGRSLVDRWLDDHAYGHTQVNLHPIAKDALVRRVALAVLESSTLSVSNAPEGQAK